MTDYTANRNTVPIAEARVGDRTWSRSGPGDLITATEVAANGDELDHIVVTDRGVISGGPSTVVSLWSDRCAVMEPNGTGRCLDQAGHDWSHHNASASWATYQMPTPQTPHSEMRSKAFADPLQRLEAQPPRSGWLQPISTHLGHPPADHPSSVWSDEREYGIPAVYTPRRGR